MSLDYKTRTQSVVEALKLQMIDGALPAGTPLKQAELAAQLGVSRIPIREALIQLETEGLVCSEPHIGAIVAKISSVEIDELFELRKMIEMRLLRIAIHNIDQQELCDLAAELDGILEAGCADIQEQDALNRHFHLRLYRPANAAYTLDIAAKLLDKSTHLVRLHLGLGKASERFVYEHRQLLALYMEKDADKACEFLENHLETAKREVIQITTCSPQQASQMREPPSQNVVS